MSRVLAGRIAELGLSYDAVSRRIAQSSGGRMRPDASLVWRWANGSTRPGPEYLRALAAALGLDEGTLRADIKDSYRRRTREASQSEKSPQESAPEGAPARGAGGLKEARDDMKRRSFLQGAASVVAAGASLNRWTALSPDVLRLAEVTGRSEVSDGSIEALGVLIDHFSTTFTNYSFEEVDRLLGPYVARVAEALSGPLTYKQRGDLCLRGAQLSGLLGRVAACTGRFSEAQLHHANAFSLAAEIDHQDLMAWVMIEESTSALDAGALGPGLDYARAALPYSRGTNRVHALCLEAFSLARTGSAEASAAISRAEDSIGEIDEATNSDLANVVFYGWAPSCSFHTLGSAWLSIDRPTEGATFGRIAVAEAKQSPSMWSAQNRAHGQVVVAGALAQNGEVAASYQIIDQIRAEQHQAEFLLMLQSTQVLEYVRRNGETEEAAKLKEILRLPSDQ